MKRRTLLVSCTALLLSFGVWQSGASAATSHHVTWTVHGPYSCVGPCATATDFSVKGNAHADSKDLGEMRYTGAGTVLDYDPATNCLIQSETYAFTTQNGKDTINLQTISDTFCFTDDPNSSIETAAFTITGGTGRFAGATGSGTFQLGVLTHPQKGSGTFIADISY